MSSRNLVLVLLGLSFLAACATRAEVPSAARPGERTYADVEARLRPLAKPLGKPQPGEWLAQHKEAGQTFEQYLAARPVRKSRELRTIYLCLLGDFTPHQREVLKIAQEYLALVYQSPVKIHREMALADVPARVRRKHPSWGMEQIQTGYVLNEVLRPSRPKDALAYICFTSSDVYPDEDWNFVFGQASLRDRTGVWSVYRFGDPAEGDEAFRQCLRRTLHTASHEMGHILTIQHCTAFQCNMNGSNSLPESDRQPLHFCPVCLRKVLWNLQAEPDAYLTGLQEFCEQHKLEDEARWYGAARDHLAPDLPPGN
jgi:archaemetzincin